MRSYWLEGADGTVLSLDGPEYAVLLGAAGLGIVGAENTFTEGAGDGGRFRAQRMLKRSLSLPVLIQGASEDDALDLYEALAGLLDPEVGQASLCVQVGDQVWWTYVVHDGGGDPGDGGTEGADWLMFTLTLTSGDPYWTRRAPERQTAQPGVTGRGLLRPGGSLSKLRLSSGQITGSVRLLNPGPAPAYPVVVIQGPATSLTLVSPLGETLSWSGVLTASQRRIIDHRAGTIVDENGVNRYNELGPAPRFWALRPGDQTAVVNLQGGSLGVTSLGAVSRTNWSMDPEPGGTGGPNIGGGWRVYPSSVGQGIGTEVFSTAVLAQATTADPGPEGAATYGQVTVTTAKTSEALTNVESYRTSGIDPVPAGAPVTMSMWIRLPIATRVYPVLRLWHDAADPALVLTEVKLPATEAIDTVPNQWTEIVVTGYGEREAIGAQLTASFYGTSPVGSVVGFGRSLTEATNQKRPFFSGTTPDTDDFDYSHDSTVTSPSRQRPRVVAGRSSVDLSWHPRRRVMR